MTTKQEAITEAQKDAIEAQFHVELRSISYDLGGSLADMVENCLSRALNKLIKS